MSDAAPDREDLLQDETTITEISIQPDGRLYVFGTSRRVLELLEGLRPNDARLGRLLRQVRGAEARATATTEGGQSRAT
jgi:hypothetical protein